MEVDTETVGAVKVGCTVFAFASVTDGPELWVQEYVSESPSGSALALPLSVTIVPGPTVCAVPAFATGAEFTSMEPIKVDQGEPEWYSPPTHMTCPFEGSVMAEK